MEVYYNAFDDVVQVSEHEVELNDIYYYYIFTDHKNPVEAIWSDRYSQYMQVYKSDFSTKDFSTRHYSKINIKKVPNINEIIIWVFEND